MNSRGFSLMEVIITIVILGVVGSFTFGFLSTEARTYAEMERARRAHQEAARIAERISREVRDADAPAVCQATNLISFMRAHVTPQDPDRYVAFRRSSNGNVYRDSCTSSPCSQNGPLMGSGVTALTCMVIYAGSVQLGYQIGVTVNYEGHPQSYTLAIFPKNYPTNPAGDCNPIPLASGALREFCGRNFGDNYEDKIF